MKRICKKSYKKIVAVILAICLVLLNSTATYAEVNTKIAVKQLEEALLATQEVTANLEKLGFSLKDIGNLLELSGKVDKSSLQALYAVAELEQIKLKVLYNYNGNPPANSDEQRQRLCNVYSIALNNPKKYYEGSLSNSEDYGKYATYLYISHYIDGPGRAPTADDLPYIISASDILSYEAF